MAQFNNIFVLNSGRCGSTTFIRACEHITNYTAGHETLRGLLFPEGRFCYPENHIEADCRLAWMLGTLERKFGRAPFYVHLWRDPEDVVHSYCRLAHLHRPATSFVHRMDLPAWLNTKGAEVWAHAHIHGLKGGRVDYLAADSLRVITDNIMAFLRDKPNKMAVKLERAATEFPKFWGAIGAEGDLDAAMREFETKHHSFDEIVGSIKNAADNDSNTQQANEELNHE